MPHDEAIDYAVLRDRFPWVGLVDDPDMPAAADLRDVMARARIDRVAVEAMDAVRHRS